MPPYSPNGECSSLVTSGGSGSEIRSASFDQDGDWIGPGSALETGNLQQFDVTPVPPGAVRKAMSSRPETDDTLAIVMSGNQTVCTTRCIDVVFSEWRAAGFDCPASLIKAREAAEIIFSSFWEERQKDKVWRALNGKDRGLVTVWVDACRSFKAAIEQAAFAGVTLRGGEHAAALAVLLRKALRDAGGIELDDKNVSDLQSVSDHLSRKAEEARLTELALDDAASALGLDGGISVARASSLLNAIRLVAEAPTAGETIITQLRSPDGTAAARQAANDIRSLMARRDRLLRTVKISDELSPSQVRKHAEGLRHSDFFSFMNRAAKAANRFYASIQRHPDRVTRKNMASVLDDLASFLKDQAVFNQGWGAHLGGLHDGVGTEPDRLEAVAHWAEKVLSTLQTIEPDGVAMSDALFAPDGKALLALRRLSKDTRLSSFLSNHPWNQASIREWAAGLEMQRDAVNNLATFLARAGIPAATSMARLPEIIGTIEAVARAAMQAEPPAALKEAADYTLDSLRDASEFESALTVIARLRSSALGGNCDGIVAAATTLGPGRLLETAHRLIDAIDREQSSDIQLEHDPQTQATSAPFGKNDETSVTGFRPTPTTDLMEPGDAAFGSAEVIADREIEIPAEVVGVLPPPPWDADLKRFPDGSEASDDMPEGGEVTAERYLGSPWSEPASRRAIGYMAKRRLGIRLPTTRINPFPIEDASQTLFWLCFGAQAEIDKWRLDYPYAEPVLGAIADWLGGRFANFRSALADAIPLEPVWSAISACLDARSVSVLRRRVAGDTLEAIGLTQTITRERIRQIERNALEQMATRCIALRAVHHPVFLSLQGHLTRLAYVVIRAASSTDGVLLPEAKAQWIRDALPPLEAEILTAMLWISEDVDDDLRSVFDPLSEAGRPFQGGRTTCSWQDFQVADLADAFERLCADRRRQWTSVTALVEEAQLSEEVAVGLARFASLTIEDGWAFKGRLRAGDGLRSMVAEVLSETRRPMSDAELLEALVGLGMTGDGILRDIARHLGADDDTFVSDGNGNWQLKAFEGEVLIKRPELPSLPAEMPSEELAERLRALSSSKPGTGHAVLEGLRHDEPDFAAQAGIRLATALSLLPTNERRSLGQVLNREGEGELLAWLVADVAPAAHAPLLSGEHELSPRLLEGLTILAAFTAAVRRAGTSDRGYWNTVRKACGASARLWFFDTQDATERAILSRIGEVAIVLDLRRDFGRGDPWAGLLALQAGFRMFDLPMLSSWMVTRRPALPIPTLVAPGPNHSASMACTWRAFIAYGRGEVLRDSIEALAGLCEWWPGWTTSEVCDALDNRRPTAEVGVTQRPVTATPVEGAPFSAGPGDVAQADERHGQQEVGQEVGPAEPAFGPKGRPLGAANVYLDPSGSRFCLALPDRLVVDPGPITLTGDDFRVGGEVQGGGLVHWYSQSREVKIKLRGPSERIIVFERHGEALEQHRIRLWEHDSYISAFSLLPARGKSFDPFVFPIPSRGGVAILLHQSLEPSVGADQEHQLDAEHWLHVFRSGLPPQLSVSCEGEILWEAARQEESRRVLLDEELHLVLDDEAPRWGGSTKLRLRDAPKGFSPRRAVIGPQSLAFADGGPPWVLPEFTLLPGMDVLRRRGRIDGRLNGERVSVPAVALLGKAPVGAALRDEERWRPLDSDGIFLTGVDGGSRLWACLPDLGTGQEWTVFEGARVAARYPAQGIRLQSSLLGLGERLSLEPRRFNLNGSGLPLAATVLYTGVVRGSVSAGSVIRVSLTKPVGWTDKHKALAWHAGGVTELSFLQAEGAPTEPAFAQPDIPVDGISLFYGASSLGNAFLVPKPTEAFREFIGNSEDWCTRLEFAAAARLPLLSTDVAEEVTAHLRVAGGRTLGILCRQPPGPATSHIFGYFFGSWEPQPKLAEAIVDQFVKTVRETPTQSTVLDRVVAEAPCAAARIVALGTVHLPRTERARIIFALSIRTLPKDVRVPVASSPNGRMEVEIENELLDRAVLAAGLDPNFLTARDVGLAALAWDSLSNPKPCQNLEIALSDAPVRRWLAVHLFSRLATSIC